MPRLRPYAMLAARALRANLGRPDFPFKLSSFNFPIYQANADGSLNWQSGIAAAASPAAVPEPSSITLLLLGLCALARRYVG